jgi:hypothetical protein
MWLTCPLNQYPRSVSHAKVLYFKFQPMMIIIYYLRKHLSRKGGKKWSSKRAIKLYLYKILEDFKW